MPSISATSDTVMLYGGSNRFNTASLRSSENRATTISQSATIWLNLEGVNYPARAGTSERKPLILYITTVSAEDAHVAGKERHGESIAHSNKRLRTPPTRPDAALPAG